MSDNIKLTKKGILSLFSGAKKAGTKKELEKTMSFTPEEMVELKATLSKIKQSQTDIKDDNIEIKKVLKNNIETNTGKTDETTDENALVEKILGDI